MAEQKQHLHDILANAVTLLCSNSVAFTQELSVEGLLGITVDNGNVILVNLKQVIHPRPGHADLTPPYAHQLDGFALKKRKIRDVIDRETSPTTTDSDIYSAHPLQNRSVKTEFVRDQIAAECGVDGAQRWDVGSSFELEEHGSRSRGASRRKHPCPSRRVYNADAASEPRPAELVKSDDLYAGDATANSDIARWLASQPREPEDDELGKGALDRAEVRTNLFDFDGFLSHPRGRVRNGAVEPPVIAEQDPMVADGSSDIPPKRSTLAAVACADSALIDQDGGPQLRMINFHKSLGFDSHAVSSYGIVTQVDGHKVYTCVSCPKRFMNRSSLWRHSTKHLNKSSSPPPLVPWLGTVADAASLTATPRMEADVSLTAMHDDSEGAKDLSLAVTEGQTMAEDFLRDGAAMYEAVTRKTGRGSALNMSPTQALIAKCDSIATRRNTDQLPAKFNSYEDSEPFTAVSSQDQKPQALPTFEMDSNQNVTMDSKHAGIAGMARASHGVATSLKLPPVTPRAPRAGKKLGSLAVEQSGEILPEDDEQEPMNLVVNKYDAVLPLEARGSLENPLTNSSGPDSAHPLPNAIEKGKQTPGSPASLATDFDTPADDASLEFSLPSRRDFDVADLKKAIVTKLSNYGLVYTLDNKKYYKCNTCPKTFRNRVSLWRHHFKHD